MSETARGDALMGARTAGLIVSVSAAQLKNAPVDSQKPCSAIGRRQHQCSLGILSLSGEQASSFEACPRRNGGRHYGASRAGRIRAPVLIASRRHQACRIRRHPEGRRGWSPADHLVDLNIAFSDRGGASRLSAPGGAR